MLKLYNTYTKEKKVFIPLKDKEVSMYTCGPTVYSYAHIGNFASYLMADLLRRYLKYLGYKVKQVKNITDVGHLVADADDGEDKLEKAARQEKKDPYEIARFYENAYLADEKKLHILEPFQRPRATECVSEMVELIKILMDKGIAYETSDGVYFSIEKFPKYGQLSGNTLDKLEAGKRVEINEEKHHVFDFALWKKLVGKNTNHIMRWDSPWGLGFPGWHIECSAMAQMFLGETIDIHTGGEDNIFPHHECEIAQSESCYGVQFVRYWVHKRWFYIDDHKMSKSLGNFYLLSDLERMGFSALDYRYLILSVHYRTKLNFTIKGLQDAALNRQKIINCVKILQSMKKEEVIEAESNNYRLKFEEALNDDLNTSGALAVIFNLIHDLNRKNGVGNLSSKEATAALYFLEKVNQVFVFWTDQELLDQEIPEEVLKLAEERLEARKNKDYATADRLRKQLKELGYEVKDGSDGRYQILVI